MVAVTLYFQFTTSITDKTEAEINEMVLDAKTLSNALLSSGYPSPWNASNVQKIGLTDDNYRLNQTKLDLFFSMNASFIRSVFDTRFNIYFYLEDQQGNIIPINGTNSIGEEGNSSSKLIHISRTAIHNSSIVKMVMQLWL